MKAISVMVAALLAATPAMAADDPEPIYMGIDLTVEPEPVPAPDTGATEQRSVDAALRDLLDEGVELGCLSFQEPATFSQIANDSEACAAYIARLAAATSTGEETAEPATVEPDNPWRAIPVVTLARAAQSGNKRAQLELGIRFEEGVGGLAQNLAFAHELYSEAARTVPERRGIVMRRRGDDAMGAAGGASPARGIVSPRIPGLPEAQERLDALEGRMER
ncbi:hypothetical protein [Aurantiacibacter gangjinensis]|uniref:Uncharacterized protein n=1 Tax=Aurantiacibacter gangjinensis TaxID=502682 RepID=A0A0G9MSI7_9SPHN|nr:hypothetical protein [Aurantiacibacter gangjinensis]APE27123.1 hypothetical protein BMF35_a0294 [Aurantiacibacter gangjinensis]KLE33534.1 hypothetical protein AAW01_06460 [Aurantiacibacter gangjinensis]